MPKVHDIDGTDIFLSVTSVSLGNCLNLATPFTFIYNPWSLARKCSLYNSQKGYNKKRMYVVHPTLTDKQQLEFVQCSTNLEKEYVIHLSKFCIFNVVSTNEIHYSHQYNSVDHWSYCGQMMRPFDPHTHICCKGYVRPLLGPWYLNKCCGTLNYNRQAHWCCDGKLRRSVNSFCAFHPILLYCTQIHQTHSPSVISAIS